MKILKYEKKGNGKYKIYLENGNSILLYEDTIVKSNLLFKKEIDSDLLSRISDIDNESSLYNKCIKYIGLRIRSKKEIGDYLKKSTDNNDLIEKIIFKLEKNNLLNDKEFARAFVSDKFRFSSMGPYRIKNELKNHNIDDVIIDEYVDKISEEEIDLKIGKFIDKSIKGKKKDNIRNRIYTSLLNNGYDNEMILRNINKYNV